MTKDHHLFFSATLLLAGAFIGAQLDDMFEPKPAATDKESNWPLVKIVAVGAVGLIALNYGVKAMRKLNG